MKRLLTASALCIAGTINAGLLGAAGATGISVLTGMIANDLGSGWERLGKHLSDPDAVLANHDLKRAVGLAIAAVLAQTAKDEDQVHYTDRPRVHKLAKYVAEHWTEFYQENLSLFPETSAIQEHQLGSLFLGEIGVTVRVFSKNIGEDCTIWQGILDKLISNSGAFADLLLMPESAEELHQTVVNLARALSAQFTQALREVFKEDFATGGRAFAGLSLDLLQLIHQSIMRSQAEIIERLDRLAMAPNLASVEGADQIFLQELARLREQSFGNQADLVAFKRDLQGDVNRVNQQLVLLRSDNLEAFIQLGDRLESGFGNLRPLFDEIGLKLEDLFAVTVAGFQEVKETQQEIIEKVDVSNQTLTDLLAIVEGLKEQQILEQSKRSPSLLTLGKPPKMTVHWQGRAEEIQQLQVWFGDRVSLIGIDGVGGIGKSSLAGKVFAEAILIPPTPLKKGGRDTELEKGSEDSELKKGGKDTDESLIPPTSPILPISSVSPINFDRGFWADVSSGVLFTDLARQAIEAFGGRVPEKEEDCVDGLVSCLQSGRFLLVVDNLESLLTAEGQWSSEFYGDFFNAWLELGSNSTILVTTREKPDLRGMEWLDLTGLSVTEGANLLAELGIQGNLAEFSALVSGYPLLLKLVADLLKDEYPQDPHLERLTALGLGNLQQLLTDERVKGVHRRQTVAIVAVLEAMVARLSPQQRHFWQRLSVFRPAFDSEMARYLVQDSPPHLSVGDSPGDWPTMAEIKAELRKTVTKAEVELRKLVKRSLLQEFLRDNRRYFDFQPVLREYARYGAGDLTQAHHQAIAVYGGLMKPNPQSKEAVEPYLEIFHHFCELGLYNAAFNMIREVDNFLNLRGFYTVRVDTYSRLVTGWEKAGLRDHWQYVAALTDLGNAYGNLGEYQRAIAFHQQSLESAREIGDRQGEANALGNLGNAYFSLGESQRAITFYQRQLDIAREIGDRRGEANALGNLGIAYKNLGEYRQAIAFQQQSLDIAREIGNRQGEAASLGNLGIAYDSLGEYQRAITFYQQQLDIAREIAHKRGEAAALGNLGNAYDSLGEYQRAIAFLQQSLEIHREIAHKQGEATALGNLGNAYYSLGGYQRAITFCQQQLDIAREIGDRQGEANALGNLGNAYFSLGESQRAITFRQQWLDIAREIGDRQGEANALGNLGNAYFSLGESQRAITFYQQWLDIAREIKYRRGEANAWLNLGLTLKKLQREADALGAFRNARQLYQAMELESKVQDCDNQINALSVPISPSPPLTPWQKIRQTLRRFWRWLSHLFH